MVLGLTSKVVLTEFLGQYSGYAAIEHARYFSGITPSSNAIVRDQRSYVVNSSTTSCSLLLRSAITVYMRRAFYAAWTKAAADTIAHARIFEISISNKQALYSTARKAMLARQRYTSREVQLDAAGKQDRASRTAIDGKITHSTSPSGSLQSIALR